MFGKLQIERFLTITILDSVFVDKVLHYLDIIGSNVN